MTGRWRRLHAVLPLRTVLVGFALVAVTTLAGCRGLEPPYPPGAAPEVSDLIAATVPALESVQVPRAKVRRGIGPAATLMLVAQAPARFSGTIQISGNELVTLAVNENRYALRWVGGRDGDDGLAPGYYTGPPSRCAVATLLGVSLEPEAFVDLILGGAPIIDEPFQILGRQWDRKTGRERLTIANNRYEQELAFAWIDGHWQFAGASLWALSAEENPQPTWLWTISHEELHTVGGEVLPAKTQIRRPKPGGKGELVINISFIKQIPNPGFGAELPADPPLGASEDELEEEQPANAGDQWSDDWDDDGRDDREQAANSAEPAEIALPEIPAQFRGNPSGLTPRGDLCAGRR